MSYRVITLAGSDPGLKQYEGFLYSTFLHSLRFGNEWFEAIEQEAYFTAYHQVFKSLLSRRESLVRVAVLTEDSDVALGWSLIEGDTLHYVYVKEDKQVSFRKRGIAKLLVPGKIRTLTQLTRLGRQIWKRKLPQAAFNPFR